jgi:hypothetical protein
MADELSKGDMLIIRQTHYVNSAFGVPYLLAQKWHKRAKALAVRGLLRLDVEVLPAGDGAGGYSVTPATAKERSSDSGGKR